VASETLLMRRAPAPIGSPTPYALIPMNGHGAEMLAKVPLGEMVAITIKRGRSLPQHNLFWSILEHVAKATEWETKERLLVALKVWLGRYDLMQLPNGKTVPVPQSISFDKMGGDEFTRFMDESIRVICEEVIPGTDSDALIAEISQMIGTTPESLERSAA